MKTSKDGRGGRRRGAGRPRGPGKSGKDWVAVSTTLSPEAVAWLDELKGMGLRRNATINTLLLAYRDSVQARMVKLMAENKDSTLANGQLLDS